MNRFSIGNIASCGICLELYDANNVIPKQLSCGHTLCSKCALQIAEGQDYVLCPDCRQQTSLDASRRLPTNYSLLGIIDQLAAKKSTDQLPSNIESDQNCCSECQGSYKPDKLRQCGTCSKSQICAECWVENHNGHERITRESLKKERETMLVEFKKHGEAVESIVTDFGERNRSIADMLSFIQQELYEHTSMVIDEAISQVDTNAEDASFDRKQLDKLNRRVTDARQLAERLGDGFIKVCEVITNALEQFQIAALAGVGGSNYDDVFEQITVLQVSNASQKEEQRTALEDTRKIQLRRTPGFSPVPPPAEPPSDYAGSSSPLHVPGANLRQYNISSTNVKEEQETVLSRPQQPIDTKKLQPLPQQPPQRPTFLDQLTTTILRGRERSESPVEDDHLSHTPSVQSDMERRPPPPRPPRPSSTRVSTSPATDDMSCSRCGKMLPMNSNSLDMLIEHSISDHDGSCILKTSDDQLCSFAASNLQWKMALHLRKTHQFTS